MSTATLSKTLNDFLSRVATQRKLFDIPDARRLAVLTRDAVLAAFSPIGAADDPCDGRATLTITSGLHRGAFIELTAREYVIGSSDDCDIVLRDVGLEPRHCRLTRRWNGFALHDLRTAEPRAVSPHTVNYHGGSIEALYDLGGVSATVLQHPTASDTSPEQTPAQRHSWSRYGVAIGALAFAVVAVAVVSHKVHTTKDSTVTNASSDDRARRLSEILEQARHTLAGGNLQVELSEGRLRIAGTAQDPELKDRIRSLGDDLRGVIAVDDLVVYTDAPRRPGAEGPFPVAVRGVMIAERSYFLTDKGARYFVGGTLPDGAEVLSIDSQQIRFRVGGRIVVYNLE
jgi:hypothetical protein